MMEEKKEIPKEEAKQELDVFKKAEEIAQRIELANQKTEELLKKKEELAAKMILGGHSQAGQPLVAKELTPKEYAKAVMRGEIVS